MRSAITILLLLVVGVAGAMYLNHLGGTVEIKVGDAWIGTSFPIALLVLAVGFLVLHGILAAIAARPARHRPAETRCPSTVARRHRRSPRYPRGPRRPRWWRRRTG